MKAGWCPGLYEPMASGDGLLVRVKPPLGCVSVAAALALAEAARKFGNGCIELTNRGNLLIRGLTAAGVAPFAAAMVACGLARADPAAERRRRVIASPLEGEAAGDIEKAMVTDTALDALPAKFVVLAGIGGDADITVRGDRLCIAGADGATCCGGAPGLQVTRVAHAFLRLRGGETRMRDLVRSIGADAVYEAAGLRGAAEILPSRTMATVGLVASDRFGFALPLRQIGAEVFAEVAAVAGRFGDGVLRTTPWRTLLVGGVGDGVAVRDALDAAGMITDEADPRRAVTTCAGRPGCRSSSVDTHRDAALLPPSRLRIHLSGCAKGCAHPAPSDITLIGNAGRYDLVLNGRTTDEPVARNLTISDAAKWINGKSFCFFFQKEALS